MKSYPTVRNIILFITAALLTEMTSGCHRNNATGSDTSAVTPALGGVTITEDLFIIHPGTKLRETDEQALYDVLKKYDKKLYRIEKIEHGKVTKSIGEFRIDGKVQSELARVGATDCNVSTDSNDMCDIGSWDRKSEELTFTEIENAKKLLAEIHPVLEKYTRR
jgi:hypothetical protein